MNDPRASWSAWEVSAAAVLAAQATAGVEPEAAARAAVAYADALMTTVLRQAEAAQAEEIAKLEEVRDRFPLGSMASCKGWGTAPVVRVERRGEEIMVSIFHEGRNSGSGVTLPHTCFAPRPAVNEVAMRTRFLTPFAQYRDRNGQRFELVSKLTEPDETHDAECLPMYVIRFEDGVEIEAHPCEVEGPRSR